MRLKWCESLLRTLTQDPTLQGLESPTAESQVEIFVHLESTFQVLKPCHVGMVLSKTKDDKQPYELMIWLLQCISREGRLSWPHEVHHALSPPFPTAFQPPESAEGDELLLKAPNRGEFWFTPCLQPQPANRMDAPCSGSVAEPESLWGQANWVRLLCWDGEIPCSDRVCQPLNDSLSSLSS